MKFKSDAQRKAVMSKYGGEKPSISSSSIQAIKQRRNAGDDSAKTQKSKLHKLKWKTEEDGRTQTAITKKIGNWEIGYIKYANNPRTFLMVRGQYYGENPIIYSYKKQVGYDNPERIPDSVKTYIFANAGKFFDTQRIENNKTMVNSSYDKRQW